MITGSPSYDVKMSKEDVLILNGLMQFALNKNRKTTFDDYIYSNFHMLDPEFPLKEEGRRVLKFKMIHLLNHYLGEKQVEGKIEDVHISNIIAG